VQRPDGGAYGLDQPEIAHHERFRVDRSPPTGSTELPHTHVPVIAEAEEAECTRTPWWSTAAGKARHCRLPIPSSYRGGMDTNSFDGGTPDEFDDQESDRTDVPMTSGGERSTTVDEDDAGILPTPEPTDGGAPAP
jgi:hypothetical protein